ncbi:paraquat-inducible protein A [Pseudoalteromonas sp. A25]|uniref:paraquat-inducible protein A n=1 Tax=Pseudoalteromonas sp. A25 TaxID=116092 RepID=UPI001260609B|nr:paraquat-inducible protein A [Pseudoalteromonas sp. A25]BBN83406.1 paraquat-inducible protein A [Pseudoalteromonas sp. A25]
MILACKHCDRLINVGHIGQQQRARCPVCHSHLLSCKNNQQQWLSAFSIASLLFLFSSLYSPFISFAQKGLSQQITLWDAALLLSEKYSTALAVVFVFTILVMPLFMCFLVLLTNSPLWSKLNPHNARWIAKTLSYIMPLNLADIFLVAVLVSTFKLMSYAELSLGYGFWAYVLFVFCFIELLTLIDANELWQRQQKQFEPKPLLCGQSALSQSLKQCNVCGQLTAHEHCPRCYAKTHFRKPQASARAFAWMLTSLVLMVPANLLPIMNTINLGQDTFATVFSGIVIMWQSGSYPIAAIIFVASICIPLFKALALFYLLYEAKMCNNPKRASQLYRWLEWMGKWSMIDVFVVIVLVSLVQLGSVLTVEPQIGIVFFAVMVLCQMMAVHSFDPRILWDKLKANE